MSAWIWRDADWWIPNMFPRSWLSFSSRYSKYTAPYLFPGNVNKFLAGKLPFTCHWGKWKSECIAAHFLKLVRGCEWSDSCSGPFTLGNRTFATDSNVNEKLASLFCFLSRAGSKFKLLNYWPSILWHASFVPFMCLYYSSYGGISSETSVSIYQSLKLHISQDIFIAICIYNKTFMA